MEERDRESLKALCIIITFLRRVIIYLDLVSASDILSGQRSAPFDCEGDIG
jgi:hypothetical protein